MNKKNRAKSIGQTSKENHQLLKKLIRQKKRFISIETFKKNNPDLTADFLYEIRLDDPKAKKNVIENRLKLKINDYMREEEEKAKKEARRNRNRKIVEKQDADEAARLAKKEAKIEAKKQAKAQKGVK